MPVPVLFPLLNANEPEAMLAEIHVSEGQLVAAGDFLFTLETTKSTAEVPAESPGFVAGLRAARGETVRAGDVFCYLADAADWTPPPVTEPSQAEGAMIGAQASPPLAAGSASGSSGTLPTGLRITTPALSLARQAGLDLAKLPTGPLVTEPLVQELIQASSALPSAGLLALSRNFVADFDPTAIVVYGGGGHGKALIDLLRSLGAYRLVGVVDDGLPAGETVMGLPVLGGREALPGLYGQGVRLAVNAVGGIGNVTVRIQVFETLAQAGFACPALVHPMAWVEPSASLSAGVQVFPHAYVGSEVRLGFGTIVNTGAIVSHECSLGECVNISPGAILAGGVQVGDGALVGMGVTVNLQVNIGARARVGNSATVKADVPPSGIVRAGAVYPA